MINVKNSDYIFFEGVFYRQNDEAVIVKAKSVCDVVEVILNQTTNDEGVIKIYRINSLKSEVKLEKQIEIFNELTLCES